MSSPEFFKIAKAYGIKAKKIISNKHLLKNIQKVLDYDGPILCDVTMIPNQILIPRVQSSKNSDGSLKSSSLDNMYPFLSDNELNEIMKIKN